MLLFFAVAKQYSTLGMSDRFDHHVLLNKISYDITVTAESDHKNKLFCRCHKATQRKLTVSHPPRSECCR